MQFVYKQLVNKYNLDLLSKINIAASSLYEKLQATNIDTINISEYNKTYLKEIFGKSRYYFSIYTFMLYHALKNNTKPFEEIVMVDYGGGTGLLSYLAYELGIENIIYVDIFNDSVADAQTIGDNIECRCNNYLHGDIENLKTYSDINNLSIDIILSSSVIEHIYNLEDFMKTLGNICQKHTKLIFSTSANIKNPLIRHKLRKVHYIDEFNDKEPVAGSKDCDTLLAHYSIRLNIIEKYAIDKLNIEEKRMLATLTRGKIENDIKLIIDDYIAAKQIPKQPAHKTNTCDPYTGNWSERLVKYDYYKQLGNENNISFDIIAGYYGTNQNESIVAKIAKTVLNCKIKLFAKGGVYLAPYILLERKIVK